MCRTYTCVPRSFSFTRHHRPAINSPAQRETKPKKAHTVLYVSHHAITLTNQSRRTHPFFHPLSKTTKGGRKLSFRPNCSRVRSSSFFLSFSAIPLFGPLFLASRHLQCFLSSFLMKSSSSSIPSTFRRWNLKVKFLFFE